MSTKTLNKLDQYLFDISNYKIVTEIKRGGFGVVNLVEDQKTKFKYAVKTNLIKNSKQNKFFISREVGILIRVQHPTIIQFRGFSYVDFEGQKNITILMDYMKNGSLADLLAKEEKGLCPSEYNNTKRQIILIGIVRGMMLLHKLHIIHRDLKPENILLDDDFYPHITDFGLSKFFDPNHSTSQSMTNIGTAVYMAPEVIETDRFNTKADVYSFGILMFELLSGKRAHKNLFTGKKKISIFQFKRRVCEGLRPEIEKGTMKKSLQIMIEKCLSKNPKDRPTFSELYKKLSLSNEDDFLDFNDQTETNVIDYEEEEEIEENEDEMGINKTFCLDSVDYEEVLCYVDYIAEEPVRYDQLISNKRDASTKQEETEICDLKNVNDEIVSFKKVEETNKKLQREVDGLKTLLTKRNDEIELLKKDQERKIEEMRKKMEDELEQRMKKFDTKIDKLTKEINQLKEYQTLQDNIIKILFDGKKSNALNGIIKFLSKKIGGNVSDKKCVIATSSSTFGNNWHARNATDFDSSYYFCTEDKPNSWIKYDFVDKKVHPTHYSILSEPNGPGFSHLMSWVVEGSNTNEDDDWKILDSRNGITSLNNKLVTCTFDIQEKLDKIEYFRYLRIRQTGLSAEGINIMTMSALEYFGYLMLPSSK